MNRELIVNGLMQEETELINNRAFYLSMIDSCNDIIKHSEEYGFTKIVDAHKKEKEDWHTKYTSANNRLKEINKTIEGID